MSSPRKQNASLKLNCDNQELVMLKSNVSWPFFGSCDNCISWQMSYWNAGANLQVPVELQITCALSIVCFQERGKKPFWVLILQQTPREGCLLLRRFDFSGKSRKAGEAGELEARETGALRAHHFRSERERRLGTRQSWGATLKTANVTRTRNVSASKSETDM